MYYLRLAGMVTFDMTKFVRVLSNCTYLGHQDSDSLVHWYLGKLE